MNLCTRRTKLTCTPCDFVQGHTVTQVTLTNLQFESMNDGTVYGPCASFVPGKQPVNNIDIEICADAPALAEPSRKTDRGAAAARMVAWEESGSRSLRLDKVNGHASLGYLCIVVWELLYAHG